MFSKINNYRAISNYLMFILSNKTGTEDYEGNILIHFNARDDKGIRKILEMLSYDSFDCNSSSNILYTLFDEHFEYNNDSLIYETKIYKRLSGMPSRITKRLRNLKKSKINFYMFGDSDIIEDNSLTYSFKWKPDPEVLRNNDISLLDINRNFNVVVIDLSLDKELTNLDDDLVVGKLRLIFKRSKYIKGSVNLIKTVRNPVFKNKLGYRKYENFYKMTNSAALKCKFRNIPSKDVTKEMYFKRYYDLRCSVRLLTVNYTFISLENENTVMLIPVLKPLLSSSYSHKPPMSGLPLNNKDKELLKYICDEYFNDLINKLKLSDSEFIFCPMSYSGSLEFENKSKVKLGSIDLHIRIRNSSERLDSKNAYYVFTSNEKYPGAYIISKKLSKESNLDNIMKKVKLKNFDTSNLNFSCEMKLYDPKLD